jgi:hypothetical protein
MWFTHLKNLDLHNTETLKRSFNTEPNICVVLKQSQLLLQQSADKTIHRRYTEQ